MSTRTSINYKFRKYMEKNITRRLEIQRKVQKVTKKEVAAALNISTQALNKKEKGENFTEVQIEAYAKLLNLEVALLLKDQE